MISNTDCTHTENFAKMPTTQLINGLFAEIHSVKVLYILISGFDEEAPARGQLELDLFVRAGDMARFSDVASRHGFLRRIEPSNAPNHVFFSYADQDRFVTLDVRIDLDFYDFRGYVWRTNLAVEDVLKNRVLHGVLYRARGGHALVLNLAHRMIKQNRRLSVAGLESFIRYTRQLDSELSLEEREEWRSVLPLPVKTSNLIKTEDVLWRVLRRYFVRTRSGAVRRRSLRKSLLGFGTGPVVLFLGTDGAGKGTLIKLTSERLFFKNRHIYFGTGREGWITRFARIVHDYSQREQSDRRYASLLFWYVILPAEFLLRRLVALPGGRWRILLVDRIPGKPFLKKGVLHYLFKWILPTPDLVVVLGGDAAIIAQRKPLETNVIRTEADILKWERVARNIDAPVLHIDTSAASPVTCADTILIRIVSIGRSTLLAGVPESNKR